MRLIDATLPTPEENLALEEILLDTAETGSGGEVLRFWESPVPFVVLGVSQVLSQEVHEAGCAAAGVPILRRCSAGGCVLQGPGCLNYALVLRRDQRPDIESIRASYCSILKTLTGALARLGVPASHEGICDMALRGLKFSGNAQKRRRNAILHHGTMLLRIDFDLLDQCIREPDDRPGYRGERAHRDFVTTLDVSAAALKSAIAGVFGVRGGPHEPTPEECEAAVQLAGEKYADPAWIRRR
jgi:lipoate-protein ligase A